MLLGPNDNQWLGTWLIDSGRIIIIAFNLQVHTPYWLLYYKVYIRDKKRPMLTPEFCTIRIRFFIVCSITAEFVLFIAIG